MALVGGSRNTSKFKVNLAYIASSSLGLFRDPVSRKKPNPTKEALAVLT